MDALWGIDAKTHLSQIIERVERGEEIVIKQALGKISAPAGLPGRVRDSGFRELPIDFTHAIAAGRLPPIHRDPFGWMLVAQARCEGHTLVTRDPYCQQYEVAILRA